MEVDPRLEFYSTFSPRRPDTLRKTPRGEPMTDGTLETIDGRPALRFERTLAHSVERL